MQDPILHVSYRPPPPPPPASSFSFLTFFSPTLSWPTTQPTIPMSSVYSYSSLVMSHSASVPCASFNYTMCAPLTLVCSPLAFPWKTFRHCLFWFVWLTSLPTWLLLLIWSMIISHGTPNLPPLWFFINLMEFWMVRFHGHFLRCLLH